MSDGPGLGCLADDYTGATDVAAALRRAGLTTVLLFGIPDDDLVLPPCQAVVVALKTRSVPAPDAVAQSRHVAGWLRDRGVRTVYFKYCSTFDSTDEGNIGPVTDALLDAAGADVTVLCPTTPEHGRTVYQGHLFVGCTLLSESPLAHHPLNPMTDPDLVRVLGRQTPHRVGLVPLEVVRSGSAAVRAAFQAHRADGVRHVVVDATGDEDLGVVAEAAADLPVLTGAAGLAGALGALIRPGGAAADDDLRASLPPGPAVVLAGSCSAATLEQVARARAVMPSHRLDPAAVPDGDRLLAGATSWLDQHMGNGPVLVYASAGPEERAAATAAMGPRTAEVLETTLGALARAAVERGARRVVVAGGETSGAVVRALGVRAVDVWGEEDTGVPWCVTTDEPAVSLLLKSGNFGRPDLLVRAAEGAA
jgi:uncharacterized protein YgbK (DUF1537 family)